MLAPCVFFFFLNLCVSFTFHPSQNCWVFQQVYDHFISGLKSSCLQHRRLSSGRVCCYCVSAQFQNPDCSRTHPNVELQSLSVYRIPHKSSDGSGKVHLRPQGTDATLLKVCNSPTVKGHDWYGQSPLEAASFGVILLTMVIAVQNGGRCPRRDKQ
jgi:hypothetical protein